MAIETKLEVDRFNVDFDSIRDVEMLSFTFSFMFLGGGRALHDPTLLLADLSLAPQRPRPTLVSTSASPSARIQQRFTR